MNVSVVYKLFNGVLADDEVVNISPCAVDDSIGSVLIIELEGTAPDRATVVSHIWLMSPRDPGAPSDRTKPKNKTLRYVSFIIYL